jgi:hypothetical protein
LLSLLSRPTFILTKTYTNHLPCPRQKLHSGVIKMIKRRRAVADINRFEWIEFSPIKKIFESRAVTGLRFCRGETDNIISFLLKKSGCGCEATSPMPRRFEEITFLARRIARWNSIRAHPVFVCGLKQSGSRVWSKLLVLKNKTGDAVNHGGVAIRVAIMRR